MQKNIGNRERALRIIAGLVIFFAGFYFRSWWGLLGLIPLLSGLIGWCGMNQFKGKCSSSLKK